MHENSFLSIHYHESALNGSIKVDGDLNIIEFIKNETTKCCDDGIDLYHAQEKIQKLVKHKYGDEWYVKSAEAVNHIIENEYCNRLRESQPGQYD